MAKIKVLSKEITIQARHKEDYISLTDITRYRRGAHRLYHSKLAAEPQHDRVPGNLGAPEQSRF